MKYFLNINAFDCSFRLFVNDLPALDMRKGGGVNTDFCINKFMINGKNEIQCFVKPFPGVEKIPSTAYVKIKVYTAVAPKVSPNEVKQIDTPEFKETDKSTLPEDYKLVDSFLGSGIADKLIRSGKSFTDSPELRLEVMRRYIETWSLFKDKNLQQIKNLFSIRDKELALLLGTNEQEQVSETMDDYSDYLSNNELDLWPMNKDKMDFKIYFNSKIVCYELKNGNSPICFVNNSEKYAVYIPMFFARNSVNNNLEIIR